MDSQAMPAEEDDRPWERPGAIRRDREPHRAALLAVLGGISLAVAGLLVCIPFASLLSLPPALAIYALALHDLAQMKTGRMDPAGQRQVRRARARAVAAILVCGLNLLFAGTVLVLGLFR